LLLQDFLTPHSIQKTLAFSPDEELRDVVFVFIDRAMQQRLRTSVGSFAPTVNVGAIPETKNIFKTFCFNLKPKIFKLVTLEIKPSKIVYLLLKFKPKTEKNPNYKLTRPAWAGFKTAEEGRANTPFGVGGTRG
jgi:hypothetical protein